VCILPDGRRVVSGSADKTLRVWDTSLGECQLKLEGHREVRKPFNPNASSCLDILQRVTSVCAVDAHRVVSGTLQKSLRVWDINTGECQRELKGHGWVRNCVTASSYFLTRG
jgi:WD40 repeat protein